MKATSCDFSSAIFASVYGFSSSSNSLILFCRYTGTIHKFLLKKLQTVYVLGHTEEWTKLTGFFENELGHNINGPTVERKQWYYHETEGAGL